MRIHRSGERERVWIRDVFVSIIFRVVVKPVIVSDREKRKWFGCGFPFWLLFALKNTYFVLVSMS